MIIHLTIGHFLSLCVSPSYDLMTHLYVIIFESLLFSSTVFCFCFYYQTEFIFTLWLTEGWEPLSGFSYSYKTRKKCKVISITYILCVLLVNFVFSFISDSSLLFLMISHLLQKTNLYRNITTTTTTTTTTIHYY